MRIVLIGIQARSTHDALPNKINLQVGGKTILQWVIDACQDTIRFLRNDLTKFDAEIRLCLLVPKGDPAVAIYQNQIKILEGDRDDVLSRYVLAAKEYQADYVVRVTADCLFLPAHMIGKHIRFALTKNRDYTTNTMYRTHKEGWDVQILSRRVLGWLDQNAKTPYDREHVCSLLHSHPRFPFADPDGRPSVCHVINNFDESHIHTSIDTPEDVEKARALFEKFFQTRDKARRNGIVLL